MLLNVVAKILQYPVMDLSSELLVY